MSAANIVVRDSTLTGNSPTAKGFFDRLLTPPIAPRETLYATLIDALVAAGIWATLDVLYLFAAADQGTAFTNLISDNYRATWPIGTCPFTADRGFTPNGSSSYVDTGFNPSAGVNFQRDNACYFVWNLAATVATGIFDTPNVSICNQLQPHKTSGGHTFWRINTSNEDDAGVVTADASGLFIVNRTTPNASSVDHNGSTVGSSSTASQAIPSANIICDTGNTAQIAAVGFGASLNNTQLGQLYTALLAYMQGVGAA